jgi:hypothetical protein
MHPINNIADLRDPSIFDRQDQDKYTFSDGERSVSIHDRDDTDAKSLLDALKDASNIIDALKSQMAALKEARIPKVGLTDEIPLRRPWVGKNLLKDGTVIRAYEYKRSQLLKWDEKQRIWIPLTRTKKKWRPKRDDYLLEDGSDHGYSSYKVYKFFHAYTLETEQDN